MFKKIISYILVIFTSISSSFANWKWLLEWISGWTSDIRQWNLDLDDVSGAIQWMIKIFLGITGSVSVIFVIIWAYYLLFGSMKQDISKWRNTITMALTGFAISALAWFIVKFVFDNFG